MVKGIVTWGPDVDRSGLLRLPFLKAVGDKPQDAPCEPDLSAADDSKGQGDKKA